MWYAGVKGDSDEQNRSLRGEDEAEACVCGTREEEAADERWAGRWWVIRYEASSALPFTSGGEGRGKPVSGRWCKRE